jgi:hypothetical protein
MRRRFKEKREAVMAIEAEVCEIHPGPGGYVRMKSGISSARDQ